VRLHLEFVGDSSKRDLNGRPTVFARTDYRGPVRWNCARRAAITIHQRLVERWHQQRANHHGVAEQSVRVSAGWPHSECRYYRQHCAATTGQLSIRNAARCPAREHRDAQHARTAAMADYLQHANRSSDIKLGRVDACDADRPKSVGQSGTARIHQRLVQYRFHDRGPAAVVATISECEQ
jgi:hypothetical protein